MTELVKGNRFVAFDRLRGLIMVVMALDHASFFLARVHVSENWAVPSQPATITRWITHLCAPGFFVLMGASMVWLHRARQQDGWSRAQIRRFFITRGAALLIIQHVVENPAWLLGEVSISSALPSLTTMPGGGSDFFLHFGVISALGAGMIFWALLVEVPSVVVLAVSAGALFASVIMTPPPSEAATLVAPWLRLLFVPGHTNSVLVVYPWVSWLAPAGLGIVVGRFVAKRPNYTIAASAVVAGVLLAIWGALNVTGFGFFTKYPPSPAFLAVTLGVDALLLALLTLTSRAGVLAPLEVFGRAPLFFYLLHLWAFALLSFAFADGASFTVTYGVWAIVVAATYPACVWYAGFKRSKQADSLWRLF